MRTAAWLRPLLAIVLACGLGTLFLVLLGAPPMVVFEALAEGAFGNRIAAADSIVKATPLLFCALAVAIAFEASLWNIGADGQLIAGALAAGAIGPHLAGWAHPGAILLILTAGATAGGVWGGLAGWLRARRDVSEVISTIMLNFVAAQMLSWAVHGPLMEASHGFPKSSPIAGPAELGLYFRPSRLNIGMLIATLLAVGCYLFLFHSVAGFKLRAIGRNRRAAAFAGIHAARVTIWTLALSGAIAGLGGAVQISAINHRLYETLSPGWGYEAIAVALVARLNPLAIVPAAIFFGALDNGAQAMQRSADVSPVLVQVIQALVIMILMAIDSTAIRKLPERSGRGIPGPSSATVAEAIAGAGESPDA
jgi:ABC-type uncharacterized transport system permease subunit